MFGWLLKTMNKVFFTYQKKERKMYIQKATSCKKGIGQAKDYRKEKGTNKEKANYKGEN